MEETTQKRIITRLSTLVVSREHAWRENCKSACEMCSKGKLIAVSNMIMMKCRDICEWGWGQEARRQLARWIFIRENMEKLELSANLVDNYNTRRGSWVRETIKWRLDTQFVKKGNFLAFTFLLSAAVSRQIERAHLMKSCEILIEMSKRG